MKQKSLFDYMVLSLFIMCMGFALSATLEYSTAARERPYLLQGMMLLISVFGALALVTGLRLSRKWAPRVTPWLSTRITQMTYTFLLLAAFALRMHVIYTIEIDPATDFETYYRLGQLLAEKRLLEPEGLIYRIYVAKFPHTLGFPSIVLAPVFSVFGVSVRVALLANLAFSMGSIVLMYSITRQYCGRLVSLVAMALMAIWPSHVLYSTMLASEPTFTFFILLCLLMFSLVEKKGEKGLRNKHPVVAVALLFLIGAFLGIANAIRPMATILLIAILMALLLRARVRVNVEIGACKQVLTRGWLCALIVGGVFFCANIIAGQGVYAAIAMDQVQGVAASGYNLMVGTNAEHKGLWNEEDAAVFDAEYEKTQSVTGAHMAAMEIGIKRMTSEPIETLSLFIHKYRDLWQTDDFGIDWNLHWLDAQGRMTDALRRQMEMIRPVSRYLYFAVLLFALIAAAQAWAGRKRIAPELYVCMLFFIGTALLHMLLETQVRYHYNMIPFLIILGSFAMAGWQERTVFSGLIPLVSFEEGEGIALPKIKQGPVVPAIDLTAPVGEALVHREAEAKASGQAGEGAAAREAPPDEAPPVKAPPDKAPPAEAPPDEVPPVKGHPEEGGASHVPGNAAGGESGANPWLEWALEMLDEPYEYEEHSEYEDHDAWEREQAELEAQKAREKAAAEADAAEIRMKPEGEAMPFMGFDMASAVQSGHIVINMSDAAWSANPTKAEELGAQVGERVTSPPNRRYAGKGAQKAAEAAAEQAPPTPPEQGDEPAPHGARKWPEPVNTLQENLDEFMRNPNAPGRGQYVEEGEMTAGEDEDEDI